jgi:membrane protease YdiL (CAAX protease family)
METEPSDAPAIRPSHIVHQEGVIAVLAVVGLAFTERGPAAALAAEGPLWRAGAVGLFAGAGTVAALFLLRRLTPVARLEAWQRSIVAGWTATDAVAVALVSGVAEEALIRALLQPILGLVPAAAVFAVLHVVPDRRLWFWPLFALAAGILLGVLFDAFGYPAAATAHVVINLTALLRLVHGTGE